MFEPQDALNAKRTIKVTYRDMRLPVQVASLQQELDIRFSSLIKTRCVGSSIPMLSFEVDFGGCAEVKAGGVDKALIGDMAAARKAANDRIKDMASDEVSGDMLREMLAAKAHLMVSIDATWVLESALVTFVTGDGGEADLKRKILNQMPDDGNMGNKTFATVTKALQGLATQRCYDFYSRAAKAIHNLWAVSSQ